MSDIFSQTTADEPVEVNLDEYVGEGKRYASPAEVLKGKLHADAHIARLEREAAELREKLKTQQTTEEIIDRITNLRSAEPPAVVTNPPSEAAKAGLSKEDVEALLKEREVQTLQTANLNTVVNQLTQKFGQNVQAEISKKAKELGVSNEYLRDIAKATPNVFMALFTAPAAPKDVFNAPGGSVRQSTLSGPALTGEKWSDFEKVRKENPKLYESPAFQAKLFKAADTAAANGRYDDFINS